MVCIRPTKRPNNPLDTQHSDVTRNCYRLLCRNFCYRETYTGLLLRYLGFGLGMGNWLSVVLIFAPLLGAVLYRIRVEESALKQSFGSQYDEYAKNTRRLIPGVY